jgi:hypothetical protein
MCCGGTYLICLFIGCPKKHFLYLSKVAELVLILPHSNAGDSMVRMNKTDSRYSLKLDGTLSNEAPLS